MVRYKGWNCAKESATLVESKSALEIRERKAPATVRSELEAQAVASLETGSL